MNRKILLTTSLLLCVSLLIPDFAFAQANESDWNMYEIINQLVRFFAWFWVVPATVAGKLMTNEFAFWEIIGLNTYLWKIRNIMRNFANFLIGALFLYFIFKTIYDGSIRASLQRIFKLLIAALLINMSWFFMTVIVDLSTVTTAAVSSLPVQVLEKTWDREQAKNLRVCPEYNVVEWALASINNNCGEKELATLWLEEILPYADNMSGPILYMWVWLLWFLSSDYIAEGQRKIETIALAELVKVLVLFMFVVPILLLVVTNMIRIFWIWVRIIFSPFIVIDMALGADSPIKKLREDGLLRTGENIWNMLWLIFLPTIVIWLMGIWLVLMSNVMNLIAGTAGSDDRWITLEQLQISGNPPTIEAWPVSTTITWSVFNNAKRRTLWFFGEIILAFMSIFIFWWILKVWFSFSSITKWITNKVFELWWWLAKSLPIVPMFGGQSINSLSQNAWEKVKRATGLNRLEQNARVQWDEILSKFGAWATRSGISGANYNTLESAMTSWTLQSRSWAKGMLPDRWIKYKGDLQNLTKKWFKWRTVTQLRKDLNSQRIFENIDGTTKLDILEQNHGNQLAWFIQWLIDGGDLVNASASTRKGVDLASTIFK